MRRIRVSEIRKKVVEYFVYENPGLTIEEIANALGISYKTAQRYLRKLRAEGRVIASLEGKDNVQHFYPNPSIRHESMTNLKVLLETFKEE